MENENIGCLKWLGYGFGALLCLSIIINVIVPLIGGIIVIILFVILIIIATLAILFPIFLIFRLIVYIVKYMLREKDTNKKAELINHLTMMLEEKNCIFNSYCSYKKNEPILKLLRKCCDKETSKIKISDRVILGKLINDKYDLNTYELDDYTFGLLEEEIKRIRIDLYYINEKLISKSEFKRIYDKYNFYLKNADRKLELINNLTLILNKLYCISNSIIEYEKIKPFISLLEKCSGNESDSFKILDDAILRSIRGNEIEIDINKIRCYNFESVQKEIEVLKEELKLIECELLSESEFEYMYNKYKNYEI